jgi:two-component system chemotaxis response regulator CheB
MIRVLIVEDSPTTALILQALLDGDPEIEVVGMAENGKEAVEMTRRLKPDLITMDVAMPVMDGLEATRQIMTHHPTSIIMVTAQADNRELNVVFEAMGAGALDVISKPEGFGLEPPEWESEFLLKVKELGKVEPQAPVQENDDA